MKNSMFMLSFKVKFLEPTLPLVSVRVAVERQLSPFRAAVSDIDMPGMRMFLNFTAQFFQCGHDGVCLLGIVNMLGFPIR